MTEKQKTNRIKQLQKTPGRILDGYVAELVFKNFTNVWTDIPHYSTNADETLNLVSHVVKEKSLFCLLLSLHVLLKNVKNEKFIEKFKRTVCIVAILEAQENE